MSGLEEYLALGQGAAFFALLLAAGASELKLGRVPGWLCAGGLAAGLALSYMRGGVSGAGVSLYSSGAALVLGGVVFGLLHFMKGVGPNEVRLAAAAGAVCADFRFMLWLISCTALAGIPLGLWAFYRRDGLKAGLKRGLQSAVTWKYPAASGKAGPVVSGQPEPAAAREEKTAAAAGQAVTLAAAAESEAGGSAEIAAIARSGSVRPGDGETQPEAGAGAAQPEEPVRVPYAVAICVGGLAAAAVYLSRGAHLPFFGEIL